MSTLTQAQLHWIFLNYNADKEEEFDKLKLIAYIIDPQRAKMVFEPQPTTEVSESSQDAFLEEIKAHSALSKEEIKEALKQEIGVVEDANFTVIEKVE